MKGRELVAEKIDLLECGAMPSNWSIYTKIGPVWASWLILLIPLQFHSHAIRRFFLHKYGKFEDTHFSPSWTQLKWTTCSNPALLYCNKRKIRGDEVFLRKPEAMERMISTLSSPGQTHVNCHETNHITANMENFSIQQPYNGNKAITVGNDDGLSITH